MTEPVETELVARLRERLEKATPAPWEACVPGDYGDFDGDSRVMCGDDKRIAVFHWNERYAEGNDADIELSVALRNAAPALLDEIERLRAELARVRKLGDAMVVDYGRAQHWMERAFADPDGLKNRLSVMDVFADQLERNRAALAAWNAEAGR